MNENLSPQTAARVLADAAGFEAAIEARTEGITMSLWGIVGSALFVTYGFAAIAGADESPYAAAIFGTLWIPWVFLGILMTHAIWRSVVLARDRPIIDEPVRAYWIRSIGVAIAVSLVFSFFQPRGPLFPLGVIGVLYLGLGTLNLFRAGPTHRRLMIVAGATLLGVAVAFGLLGAPIEVTGLVGIVTPAAVLCTLGLWTAFRG